jgi:hypothetical protein
MDWDLIKSEFLGLRALVKQMPTPPSERELQTHRVKMKLKSPSALKTQLDWDYRAYYGSTSTKDRLDRLKEDVDSGGAVQLPSHFDRVENCFVTIERSIAAEECSIQFILAWGYLNQLVGRFLELMEFAENQKKDFERNERAGAATHKIVQQYWHAHWVIANSDTDRKIAESELAALCADIWQGRLLPPAGYKAEWFKTLITGELGGDIPKSGNGEDATLKTTYGRTKPNELEDIVKSKDVDPALLPPLRRTEFRAP